MCYCAAERFHFAVRNRPKFSRRPQRDGNINEWCISNKIYYLSHKQKQQFQFKEIICACSWKRSGGRGVSSPVTVRKCGSHPEAISVPKNPERKGWLKVQRPGRGPEWRAETWIKEKYSSVVKGPQTKQANDATNQNLMPGSGKGGSLPTSGHTYQKNT